jgi:DNA polymerase III delta prime subunit
MEKETKIEEIVKRLSENTKSDILKSINEVTLRSGIKELLQRMEPSSYVEIYHGQDEYGKDLVMIRKSLFGDAPVGIVVIRGDIKTQSSGLIDKIKSQVEQCFIYPASLKTVKGQLNMSSVWVMVAGMLSKGANTRLTAEIPRSNVSIYDLRWLVDNFTKHYPYIFFESRVSEYIEDKIKELEGEHIIVDKKWALTDYYVPQSIGTLDRMVEISPEAVFSIVKDITSINVLKNEIKTRKKLLIAGEPGVGKSTALNKIAIDLLSDSLESATRKKEKALQIPLLLRARDFIIIENVEELLNKVGPGTDIRNRFVVNALMVDGLDEVAGELREELVDKAIGFADSLKAALLITSRKIDFVKRESLKLSKRELLPMEFGQAIILFNRLVKDEKKLVSLKEGLQKISGQLSMTPLALLLLIELVEANKEIPASITLLYNKFFDIALGLEDRAQKGLELLFDPEIKRTFLEVLAFEEFFKKNRDRISKKEFEQFIEDYAKGFEWDVNKLKVFVSEIERAGLLDIREQVGFAHATFLDYFTASRIFNIRENIDGLNEYLAEIYFNSWWHDVVFYYAGLKKFLTKEFIDNILESDKVVINDLVTNVLKVLMGRLLQAAWQTEPGIKEYGVDKSLDFCGGVRDCFLGIVEKQQLRMPLIYSDFYTMLICETAYGSMHLWNQEKKLIESYLENPSHQMIFKAIKLIWANKDRIQKDEKDYLVGKLYEKSLPLTRTNIEDNSLFTKNLLFLKILANEDEDIFKSIQKRISREYKLNPVLFNRLLPAGRTGFRSSKAREEAKRRKERKKKAK